MYVDLIFYKALCIISKTGHARSWKEAKTEKQKQQQQQQQQKQLPIHTMKYNGITSWNFGATSVKSFFDLVFC